MPHTQGAWKRLRQTEKRKKRNRQWAKVIKKEVREVAEALKAGDAATASTELVSAAKKLDSAADKGIIHKNKAARLKSRMAKKINKAKAGGTTAPAAKK